MWMHDGKVANGAVTRVVCGGRGSCCYALVRLHKNGAGSRFYNARVSRTPPYA